MALSVIIGVLVRLDPTLAEIMSHSEVGMGDIVLALTSGC
jgi:hypothetical protein